MVDKIARGVYPVMLTPYRNGEIDEGATRRLVDWYIEQGCTGIFAVCQSSEMWYLSLAERVRLARITAEQAKGRANVVASGHCADSINAQIEEIKAISDTGIDAFVLVSNRFDLFNDGDDVWLRNAEKVLSRVPDWINFGIYECPHP